MCSVYEHWNPFRVAYIHQSLDRKQGSGGGGDGIEHSEPRIISDRISHTFHKLVNVINGELRRKDTIILCEYVISGSQDMELM